ncbi:CzcE family metal-binding protein [Roseateles chitosanitabidus]|jgi:hypothetical protein|uniref:CzcE family metal-binding protein n=1 Tax=Roseateles chitosanitabidus TaxID=65048 RepID=UPI00082B1575|nr:CzcE family metal-binding protein [Roseateles chitosanitabidus]MBO9687582.1 CzcE family metal-binding protein [Roseateles chitosanitabidus]
MKASLSLLSAVATLTLAAGAAQAAAPQADQLMNGRSAYGVPAAGIQADKVVDVKDGGSLNIDCGQTVEFRDGGKSFTWKFDSVQHRAVNLAQIAPSGFGAKGFVVHVSRNEAEGN